MATVPVTANANLATPGLYAADDDIVIAPSGTALVTLTCNSNPNALPAIRSIRSTSARAVFKVRNSATAFSAGNLWKLNFTNPGAAIGASAGTLGFTAGATCDWEGEFLECYTATGASGETVLDASNVLGVDIDLPYAVQVESAPGSGVWDWVVVAVIGGVGNGYLVTASQSDFGTGLLNRVLFYDHTTRLLKTGTGTNGTLFAAGTKFRIPNIMGWIPPFTLTTAAGWTTGAVAQPVVSSTNAPLSTYLVGSEVVNVNAIGAGTVTTNTRGVDGTTAAAPAAGVTMYCVPQDNVTSLAGKIVGSSGGVFRFKNCFFGRWWAPQISSWSTMDFQNCGLVFGHGSTARPSGVTDSVFLSCVAVYVNPVRGTQSGWGFSNNQCPVYIDKPLIVGHVNAVSTTSLAQNNSGNLISWNGNSRITNCSNIRAHAVGLTSTSVFSGRVNIGVSSTVFTAGAVTGIETVGGQFSIFTSANPTSFSRIRYSSTNGALNTATADIAVVLAGQGGVVANAVIRDFDILDGGIAPRQSWFSFGGGSTNCVYHNQVNGAVGSRGSPRTINCQSRTVQFNTGGAGGLSGALVASTYLSSMAAGSAVMSAISAGGVVRNIRTSNVTNGPQLSAPGITFDFPPQAQGGATLADMPVIYAFPDTYPPTTGVLRVGGFPREIERDLYTVTGSGAYHDPGNLRFSIETSGDVITINSAVPVTGIGSIPSTGSVTFSGTSATSGITYEFRLCNWGADITAVSWATFDRATFKTAFDALTGYTSENGLNIQIRATATTSVAGRTITQMNMPVNMNASHNPAVGTVPLGLIGAADGATAAFYATFYTAEGLISSATVGAAGTASVSAPYDYDDVPITYRIKVRKVDFSSEDVTGTYTQQGATAPTIQVSLTGYVAGPYAGASFNKATKVVTVSSAMTTQQLWSAWREYIVQLANFDVADDWTYAPLNAGTWEVAFSGAGAITGSYTDRNGTLAPITAPNLPVGTRVQFYNVTDSVQLTNEVLAGAGASTSLYFTAAKTIRLRASKLGSLPIEAFGVMSASGLTFIDSFVADDVYNTKGIDGSTVTEFTADEPNVQIDSNDPDGVSSVWRCYAWFRYYETLSLGVAGGLFGAANAIDTENLAIDSSRANIQLDNVSAVPLKINDGYMYRTDGATLIAPTSGSIQMDPKKAYGASGGGGSAADVWNYPNRTLVPVGGVTSLY